VAALLFRAAAQRFRAARQLSVIFSAGAEWRCRRLQY
jgi:hypothetical protein